MRDIHGLAGYLERRFEKSLKSFLKIKLWHDDNCLMISIDGCFSKYGKRYAGAIKSISNTLADYVIKTYEKDILERIIHRICGELPKKDTDEIFRLVCTRLYAPNDGQTQTLTEARKKLIAQKIADYLKTSDNLTLEGFVTFRLGEYVKRLETEVERSIRQYFVERQYEEYINLLTTFVRMQVPRVPELHVTVQNDGSYKVEGTAPFEIPEDVSDGFGIERDQSVIRDDDFMIGFLLSCAPIRIIIHRADNFKNRELLNTIRIVFSECVLMNE